MAIISVYTATTSANSIEGETLLGEFNPSSMTWGFQDISSGEAGRTASGKMYKCLVTSKRKLSLSFDGVTAAQASAILQAFNREYFKLRYPDAMQGGNLTRTFYIGDRSAPVYMYTSGKKIYQNVSFDVIER